MITTQQIPGVTITYGCGHTYPLKGDTESQVFTARCLECKRADCKKFARDLFADLWGEAEGLMDAARKADP